MTSAIIVAAGEGKRMGSAIPKQFLKIGEHTILWHTVNGFVTSAIFEEIIIVLSKYYLDEGVELQKSFPHQNIILCQGGEQRFHSVKNALAKVAKNCQAVFIHDAVRPFFSTEFLQKCLTTWQKNGSAIPSIAINDSIRKIVGEKSIAQAREFFRSIQTPQVFDYKKLVAAYGQDYRTSYTDDASVYEQAGEQIFLVEGEVENIKITTPADLDWATFKLRKNLED